MPDIAKGMHIRSSQGRAFPKHVSLNFILYRYPNKISAFLLDTFTKKKQVNSDLSVRRQRYRGALLSCITFNDRQHSYSPKGS